MLVYGDRSRREDPRQAIEALSAAATELVSEAAGVDRHGRLVSALIAAGELAQGLADCAFEQRGCDAQDPASDLAMQAARGFAGMVASSWRSEFNQLAPAPLEALRALTQQVLPPAIGVKACEGYGFYAVYPELYIEAARRAVSGPAPRVIGLRSIGTSLAAAAAAGAGAGTPLSLRPVGDPYDRELRLEPVLAQALLAPSAGGFAVVDEGPGRSGSSFAAAADLLEQGGARPDQIVFLPSHDGGPGGEAGEVRRDRWRRARRAWVGFDELILPGLADWAAPLVGRAIAPLQDLSGGVWREARRDHPPAWPEQERRKYRLETDQGAFLLKFAGLGAVGQRKLARARALYAEGFTPEPMGLAHGFLVERWVEDGRPLAVGGLRREALLAHLIRYLGFRARQLPAGEGEGAGLAELTTMIGRNLSLAGLNGAVRDPPAGVTLHPVQIDGRLQPWEWLQLDDGRLLKTDAIDHCEAHDLIGCQDIAWDVAGASVEFGLSAGETESLRSGVEAHAGRPLPPALLDFMTVAYLAFQIGWWRLAAEGCDGERAMARAREYERICACLTKP